MVEGIVKLICFCFFQTITSATITASPTMIITMSEVGERDVVVIYVDFVCTDSSISNKQMKIEFLDIILFVFNHKFE